MNNKDYADYVFLIPGKEFSKNFICSWTDTLVYLYENNYTFKVLFSYCPVISTLRNQMLSRSFLTGNNSSDVGSISSSVSVFNNELFCKKIIFIDSDMVWKVEDIDRLIKSEYDVVAGLYTLSDGKTISAIKKDSDIFITKKELNKIKNPFPIKSAGLGFVACTYEILSQVEYPWFFNIDDMVFNENENKYLPITVGEDIAFFAKLSMLGDKYKIMADPLIKVGHEKSTIYTV